MKQRPRIKQNVIENHDKNDLQFNRHDFRSQFLCWPTRLG